MAKKKSEMEYLESFEKIFPNLYEYSKFPEKFNQKTKIKVYCKKHKYHFYININNLMNGHGCPKCGKEKMVKTKGLNNQEKYRKIIEENYKDVFDLSEIDYSNCKYEKSNIFVTCKKCGKRQRKNIVELIHKRAGCTCDKYERMDWYYSQIRLEQTKKIQDFSKKVFGNRLDVSNIIYKNLSTKIKIHCNVDNYDFYVKPSNFIYKCQGCPICSAKNKMSSFARVVMYYLDDHNIKYFPEYIVENNDYLKNKPYDFYLEDFKLLLEIDGDQHRRPAFGRTHKDLLKQQEIDLKKIEKGKEEGYIVLRLNTDEDFLAILDKYLEDLKVQRPSNME